MKFTNEEKCNLLTIIFIFWTIVLLIIQQYGLSVFFLFLSIIGTSVRTYYKEEEKK